MRGVILALLFFASYAGAETLNMPLATLDADKWEVATIFNRPEVVEYAESVKRIGNVILINWNEYDTEAISIPDKEKKEKKDGDDVTYNTEIEKNPTMIANSIVWDIFDQKDNSQHAHSELIRIAQNFINGDYEYDKFSAGILTQQLIAIDYELTKEAIITIHKESGSKYELYPLISEAKKRNKVLDTIVFLEKLRSIESGGDDKLENITIINDSIVELKTYHNIIQNSE
jgi:hypothetical protein